jgi:hypothetical protein
VTAASSRKLDLRQDAAITGTLEARLDTEKLELQLFTANVSP